MKISMKLFLHANGNYYIRFDRNRRRSLGTKNFKLAQKLFDKAKERFLLNKLAFLQGRPPGRTLAEFAAEYAEWCMGTRAKHGLDNIRTSFKRLLAVIDGASPLSQIDQKVVDQFQSILARQLHPASVNTYLSYLKSAFDKAREWRYLETNPFQKLAPLKEPQPHPRYLSREDLGRILEAETAHRWHCFWLFIVLTGCRRGEALDLTWKDVDLKNRRITVMQKTGRGKTAWITAELLEVLQALGPGVGRLFPWSRKQATTRFVKLAASVGVHCRLHDLRHTFAAYLIMAGVGLSIVKDLMGHASISSTMAYSHLAPEYQTQALAKLQIAANLRQIKD